MPYIPHTASEESQMLAKLGLNHLEDLFSEIPQDLNIEALQAIPEGLNEMALGKMVEQAFEQDAKPLNFAGAGSYEHHIPAAVWDLVMRGEYLTAYTPYQAEASQGTLQLLWEYQTMMASLMGHDVSNASLYDGASALVEAVLMALRLKKAKEPIIYVPKSLHPLYRETLASLLNMQDMSIVPVEFDKRQGRILIDALDEQIQKTEQCHVLVIPQPNFFGHLEDVDALTHWAHQHQAMVVGCVNPMSMAWLKPPGQWGEQGADIACGEGQPLGVPMNRGGPYFGFLTCKQNMVRQLPGRLIGETLDANGQRGFSLTLQAREQHIRRAKATSNICTNQGLLVTAATIYMSLMGPLGLKEVAQSCHHNAQQLKQALVKIPGIETTFEGPCFHEIVLSLPCSAKKVIDALLKEGIFAGIDVSAYHPELPQALLVCVTETKTQADIEKYAKALEKVVGEHHG